MLINTTADRNRDLNEPGSIGQKLVTGLIRLLAPPQLDNEKAADILRVNIGRKQQLPFCIVPTLHRIYLKN